MYLRGMKNEMPLVSVTIPTFNNEKTIERTLRSVKAQTYENIEIIVIDSHSKDKTLKIIKKFPEATVYQYEGTLLGARGVGVDKAKGEFVVLVDSDHILEPTAIERAVKLTDKYDMLWFYERSWKPKKVLEVLYDADRVLCQKHWQDFIRPVGGVLLPRFYKREILVKAFKNMPKEILPLCVAHDHAIIYYEADKLTKKLGKLDNAIFHMEPWSWTNLFKKTYRYGITTRKLVENNAYPELLKSKDCMRKFYWNDLGLSIKSNLLRAARGVPYKLGYWFGDR
jgi:glycosyltransferase involved in cell wall biosynthesis